MYKVPEQNEPTHQQMLTLYQHMMQWTANSKKAWEQQNFEEHHRLLERMTELQQGIVSLFEPPSHATEEQKKACRVVQASARKVLIDMFDYVRDPHNNYGKLCQTLMRVHAGWQQFEKK